MNVDHGYNAELAKRLLLHAGALCERLAAQAAGVGASMLRGEQGRELVERSGSIALLTEAAVVLISITELRNLD